MHPKHAFSTLTLLPTPAPPQAQYATARNKYLRQRVEEQMADYAGTWDSDRQYYDDPKVHQEVRSPPPSRGTMSCRPRNFAL